MFSLGVELLMRRAIISRLDNRDEPEWPPHPDRVFMALVAAWGENGEDPAGKAALEWLESLSSPAMRVSVGGSRRTACTSYVPSNDAMVPALRGKEPTAGQFAEGIKVLPEHRGKNARSFAAVVPDDPTFHFVWPDAELPDAHREAITVLCEQATYLGHSATPIQMWVEPVPVAANLAPTAGQSELRFRVFGTGRMEYLKGRFDAGLRPLPTVWQGYRELVPVDGENSLNGPFDPGLIVLRQVGGRRLSLESAGMIADAIRNTLMSRHADDAPEWLSGHAPDGSPSRILRPAYLPLSFVGSEHADGHILGVAIAVPREFPEEQLDLLYELLGRHDGRHDIETGVPYLSLSIRIPGLDRSIGMLELVIDETNERNPKRNLKPSSWTGPAALWTTVTPLILPRFPRRDLTAEMVISKACIDAGFPEPIAIRASLAPLVAGVPHANSFCTRSKQRLPPRPLMHAQIQFAERLRGPVIIGTGRFMGFGVCRPLHEEGIA